MKKSLSGKWLLDCNFGTNLLVTVPGSIYNDLYNYKFIENPYYRANEENMLDLMNYDYTYHRTFKVNKKYLNKNIDLVFLGLDTITEIYLNGCLLGKTYNMHRRYRFNVNKYLKEDNEIIVIIKSPLKFIKEEEKKCTHELMQMHYAVRGYNHIRKAHSMFGWDWGPQMPDGGIWRDLYLDIYEDAYIDNVWFKVIDIKNSAFINVSVSNVIKNNNNKLNLEVKLLDNDLVIYTNEIKCKDNNQFDFEVKNPKLWYPYGYGEQPLYDLVVSLKKGSKIIYKKEEAVGIRKCEIKRNKDEYGESFTVSINNQDIFLKGSDYIIEDNVFPWRDNARTKYLLDSAILGNQNCLRVWGGGIFPDDYFYQECDRLGIIIWQDLMFACTYYNMENADFVCEIKEEIIDNIKRIRNHACIALICGNNENETAANDWNVPNLEYTKKWYLYQYEEFIPSILKDVCPNIFYWPSSPSSGGGFDKPNDDSRGDMHYWGVWHNNEPIEYYRHYFPRVMSEFGMQSFPLIKTVKTFTKKEDRNIFSYVMERHQKNTSANQKIMNYIGSMFKFPKNFEMLLYISEIIQAEGVRYCVEHLRRNYGRCMGSIYWQLNDCWPVASWSSIDYYGRYKALQYYSKRFYNPILVSIEENYDEKCCAKIVVTNETNNEISGICKAILMDFSGNIFDYKEINTSVNKYSKKDIINLEYNIDKETRKNTVLKVLFDDGKEIYQNQVCFCKDKYLELNKPIFDIKINKNNDLYELSIKSNTYTKYVFIDHKKKDFIFSDNFFNLFPNEEKIITFKSKDNINIKDFVIYNLYDEYN